MGKFRHLQDVRQKFCKNAKSRVLVTGKVEVLAEILQLPRPAEKGGNFGRRVLAGANFDYDSLDR